MPNWCSNTLIVRGPKADLRAFVDAVAGTEEPDYLPSDFEINRILEQTSAHDRLAAREKAENEHAELLAEHGLTAEQLPIERLVAFHLRAAQRSAEEARGAFDAADESLAVALNFHKIRPVPLAVQLRGYDNAGHSWCIKHWGTKWALTAEDVCLSEDDDRLEYHFDTAWSPPTGIVEQLIVDWPTLDLLLLYIEEGSDFVGAAWRGPEGDLISVDGSPRDYGDWPQNENDEEGDDDCSPSSDEIMQDFIEREVRPRRAKQGLET